MVDNNLLRKQFIWIRMDNSKVRILFLDTLAYKQFEKYEWPDLSKGKKKIRIKVIAKEFEYPYYFEDTETAYNCVEMLSIDKIDGETYWTK